MHGGIVYITLDDIVAIAAYDLQRAQRLSNDLLDTAVSCAMDQARKYGVANILTKSEWQKISAAFKDEMSIITAIESHIYPRAGEQLAIDFPPVTPYTFWVRYGYDDITKTMGIDLTYSTPHR